MLFERVGAAAVEPAGGDERGRGHCAFGLQGDVVNRPAALRRLAVTAAERLVEPSTQEPEPA